jgi:hypothetical protein
VPDLADGQRVKPRFIRLTEIILGKWANRLDEFTDHQRFAAKHRWSRMDDAERREFCHRAMSINDFPPRDMPEAERAAMLAMDTLMDQIEEGHYCAECDAMGRPEPERAPEVAP